MLVRWCTLRLVEQRGSERVRLHLRASERVDEQAANVVTQQRRHTDRRCVHVNLLQLIQHRDERVCVAHFIVTISSDNEQPA